MGLFESIKNTFGKGAPATDVTTAPSQLLREAGLDPSGLRFTFGSQSITVAGTIAQDGDRQKILDLLAGLPGIESVQDEMSLAAAPEPEATAPAEPEHAPEPAAPAETVAGEARTYTVVSGDTLWKISEQMYGKGSLYMKIFEANTDLLEHPDRIFPGQKLRIPEP